MTTGQIFHTVWAWQALNTWGAEAQVNMVIEECSELILALVRYTRGRATRDNIVEEVADVSLMLDQLRELFKITGEELEVERRAKIVRLTTMLEMEEIKRTAQD